MKLLQVTATYGGSHHVVLRQNASMCNVCLLSFGYIVQVALNSHHFSGFSVHEKKESSLLQTWNWKPFCRNKCFSCHHLSLDDRRNIGKTFSDWSYALRFDILWPVYHIYCKKTGGWENVISVALWIHLGPSKLLSRFRVTSFPSQAFLN